VRRLAAFRARLRALGRDERGATVIEFAIIAPVMGMLLLGAFDVAHTLYVRSVLQGIVQKVARDATLESAWSPASRPLDDKVRRKSRACQQFNITITRRYYRTFTNAAAGTAEPFTDTNKNNKCDAGEPYQDNNNNSKWDKTGGNDGQGGAKDKVLLHREVSYPRLFPI
jgi:Flp pilus assembly protein TadG